MRKQDISVEELSKNSGIAAEDLEKILSNKKVIEPFHTILLAKALNVDVNALFQEP